MSLKVSIRNKNILILEENGKIGDEIDLRDIQNLDLTEIEAKINEGRDEVYKKKLDDALSKYNIEKKNEINNAKAPLEKRIIELESEKKLQKIELDNKKDQEINELKEKYNKQIEDLRQTINIKEATKEQELTIKEQKLKEQYQDRINELEKRLDSNKNSYELDKARQDSFHLEEINKLKAEIQKLRNQKAAFGSKLTGENLEIYCDNLYKEASQNGFDNCKWYKDNRVIKEEGEEKGTKADYIFEVYASSECKEDELLTNVCLEMKDENPDSVNRKTNDSFYKTLDKNREKKHCKYALLVSNLDSGASNDLPIMKIKEYKDMYMVRPGYMMTFLNMVASLSNRFQELILKDYENEELIKKEKELLDEFDNIKALYLDTPLERLKDKVEDISKKSDTITKAASDIKVLTSGIIDNYIDEIKDKLDKFDIRIKKAYKKYDK